MDTHWEPLGGGLKVLVSAVHRFNTDTLLLADFSMPCRRERCADLGCGCGTIPLLWCSRGNPGPVTALELQEDAAVLAERSVRENGLESRVSVLQGDLRDYKALLPHQGLDLAVCNPPYYPPGTGLRGEVPQRTLARHGEGLSLEDLARAARYALKCGGRLCLCLPTFRLAEAASVFSTHSLEPKRLRLVQARREKPAYLFLLECRSGGKPGLQTEPVLILQERNGVFSPEMKKIYGDYYGFL